MKTAETESSLRVQIWIRDRANTKQKWNRWELHYSGPLQSE